MISLSRPSLSWPSPGPPSSSSRKSAHRPWSLTCCWMPLTCSLTFGSFDRTAYGNTYSSGSTSSRQKSSTQSSFFWNSGSVEKSHAMDANLLRRHFLGPAVVGLAGGGAHDGVDEDERLGQFVASDVPRGLLEQRSLDRLARVDPFPQLHDGDDLLTPL